MKCNNVIKIHPFSAENQIQAKFGQCKFDHFNNNDWQANNQTQQEMSLEVKEIHIEEQKSFDEVGAFPLVLAPGSSIHTLNELLQWIPENKKWFEEKLLQHTAVLLRGFAVDTAKDFDDVVCAFGYENLPYVGGAAPRKHVTGNVYTANEAPADVSIPFHHEMAQIVNWPKKLYFYGDVIPDSGGETPICVSNEVYKRMLVKHRDFVEKLETLGVKYIRVLPEENDDTSPLGRGWKSTFSATTKEEAEKKCKELSIDFEWLEGDNLKTTSEHPLYPIQVDIRTGKKVWFNSIVAAYTGWNDSRNVSEKAVHFGDGSPLPRETVYDIRAIMEEICVNHKWQHGDVLLIDNRTAMHARRAFTGNRLIYASLTKS